jgi:hypothetical protein
MISLFSGELRGLLIREKPTDRIDSYYDLYTKLNWETSKIYVPKYLDMFEFNYTDSEMAMNFRKRSEIFDPIEV